MWVRDGALACLLFMRVVVRVSSQKRRNVQRRGAASRGASLAAAAGLLAATVCAWKWCHDPFELAPPFPFTEGLAAQWQVWFGAAAALLGLAGRLNRATRPSGPYWSGRGRFSTAARPLYPATRQSRQKHPGFRRRNRSRRI